RVSDSRRPRSRRPTAGATPVRVHADPLLRWTPQPPATVPRANGVVSSALTANSSPATATVSGNTTTDISNNHGYRATTQRPTQRPHC
ncbi:Hypothetical protein CINCED_3A013347, partial [Cinara cedri]